MSQNDVQAVLDRVRTWPKDKQKDAVRALETIESEFVTDLDDDWVKPLIDEARSDFQKRAPIPAAKVHANIERYVKKLRKAVRTRK